MPLNPNEIKEIKDQLKAQNQNLPEPQKSQLFSQIDNLSDESVEELVRQNKERYSTGGEKTIYRMLVSGEVPSTKLDENEFALGVLDINPISEGHILLIPKKEVKSDQKIPSEILDFAGKISDKVKDSLKAKKVNQIEEEKFGERVLNLIPIYDQELNLSSARKKSTKEELEFVQKKILDPPRPPEVIRIQTTPKDPPLKIKRRIP